MTSSVFERVGGMASLRRVVRDFYDRVLDDELLAHHFAEADLRALVEHQTAFVLHLTGGPGARYSDEVLHHVHRGLGVTAAEFDRMLVLLGETFDDHGVADEDVAVVLAAFEQRRGAIVGTRRA